jgi:hypothetical protein
MIEETLLEALRRGVTYEQFVASLSPILIGAVCGLNEIIGKVPPELPCGFCSEDKETAGNEGIDSPS